MHHQKTALLLSIEKDYAAMIKEEEDPSKDSAEEDASNDE
jgi:hypothetical protein